MQRHRIRPPGTFQDRGIPQQAGVGLACHRGAHRQQPQILPQGRARLERQRQPQVGLQAAFMAFIEDHQPVVAQSGIALDQAGENAIGHDLDAGARTDALFQTHAVTHGLAHRFMALRGHAPGGHDGGESARLQHQDAPPRQPGSVQQRGGNGRGLPRPRRRLQHQDAARGQQAADFGQQGGDGQGGCHGNLVIASLYPSPNPGTAAAIDAIFLRFNRCPPNLIPQ